MTTFDPKHLLIIVGVFFDMMSEQQRSVNLPSSVMADGESGEKDEEETKTFLFKYLSRRAQIDGELSDSSAEAIRRHGQEAAAGTDSTDAATNVANRLADLGEFK